MPFRDASESATNIGKHWDGELIDSKEEVKKSKLWTLADLLPSDKQLGTVVKCCLLSKWLSFEFPCQKG